MTAASYLVDTDCVIHHFKGNAKVTQRLDELRNTDLCLSMVSLAELWEGIIHSRDPVEGERQLARFLTGIKVLPMSEAVCKRFGFLRGRQRKLGKPIPDFDLLIAATALHHGMTLISNNRRHFEPIEGLSIESL